MSVPVVVNFSISQQDQPPSASLYPHTYLPRICSSGFPLQPTTNSSPTFQLQKRCSSVLLSPSSCPWPLLRRPPGTSLVLARQISPVKSTPNTRLRNFLKSVGTGTDISPGPAMEGRAAAHLQTLSVPTSGSAREKTGNTRDLGPYQDQT